MIEKVPVELALRLELLAGHDYGVLSHDAAVAGEADRQVLSITYVFRDDLAFEGVGTVKVPHPRNRKFAVLK